MQNVETQAKVISSPPANPEALGYALKYTHRRKELPAFEPGMLRTAVVDALRKLDPRTLIRNPVIFMVEVGAALTTLLMIRDAIAGRSIGFSLQITLWLWFTVLFANFAEALAEGRGKAHAASLRRAKTEVSAKRLAGADPRHYSRVPATSLRPGDLVLVEAGDIIPSDGEVIEGVASVNEAAITGESAPVIRESGGDRSAVTGGTLVISDWIKVRITAAQGSTFLDHMIALVEGAQRQKTPNEIALNILLAGMSIIFLLATVTIPSFAAYASGAISVVVLVALLVTLIPTTIGALLSAIGIAGMNRLAPFNVLALSGRAVEAAGDVDTLLLDKTGTITLGDRMATEFIPLQGVNSDELVDAAQLASLSDETPEGRSIVVLAKKKYGLRGRHLAERHARHVPFSAQTRMSGVDLEDGSIRKGAVDAVIDFVKHKNGGQALPAVQEIEHVAERISRSGGTPLAVARDNRLLGVVHLKDVVKGGIRERFAELRRMGIRTVMITGDNPLTAAAIAAEAGVDDFLAQATPEQKLKLIRGEQVHGKLVAMCGDGTNDAPGTGASGCRGGDEYRHDGGARGGEHDRPRQRPDQAHRGRGDRQAAPDHPRGTDHLLHRQRRGQVLRHHPRDVRRHLSGLAGAERDAAGHTNERRALGHHLQCLDHPGAHPARASRRQV